MEEQFEDAFAPIIEEAIRKTHDIECGTAVRIAGLRLMIQYLKSELASLEPAEEEVYG